MSSKITAESLEYMRRWRNNNREKVREQARKYAKRKYHDCRLYRRNSGTKTQISNYIDYYYCVKIDLNNYL